MGNFDSYPRMLKSDCLSHFIYYNGGNSCYFCVELNAIKYESRCFVITWINDGLNLILSMAQHLWKSVYRFFSPNFTLLVVSFWKLIQNKKLHRKSNLTPFPFELNEQVKLRKNCAIHMQCDTINIYFLFYHLHVIIRLFFVVCYSLFGFVIRGVDGRSNVTGWHNTNRDGFGMFNQHSHILMSATKRHCVHI